MINPAAQLERLLQKALQSHRAGRLAEAESGYRAVLSHDPEHSEALHLLGILAAQSGRPDLAVALLQRAVAADPASAAAHSNLGSALQSASRLEEALSACRHAIALDASSAEAHYNLGVVLQRLERFDEAALAFQESARLNPNAAGAFNNLGIVLEARGRIEEAVTAGKRAVALDPTSADNQINLGNALQSGGLLDEAIVAYREAIRLQPSNASAQSNLSSALFNAGQIDEAADAAREASRLEPNRTEASNNLGNCYRAQALPAQALDSFRQALAHAPNFAEAQSNYLFTHHFDPQLDAQRILTEHRAWGARMARLTPDRTTPYANDRSSERCLRIGFVSPDLRNHVVGHSLRALLQERDRKALEMVCYANIRNSDAVTDQLRVLADGWRNIAGQSDADVARQIEADRIDILFDLAVHSGGNRLALFARKPAPIQVSYLGYPGTTGLDAIDYRLSDAYIDPVGEDSDVYSEETIRLPHCYWLYAPPGPTTDVSPLPASSLGRVTFGCLNNFAKVSATALACWIEILCGTPTSRLLLLAPPGSCRERVRARFAESGLKEERLEFVEKQSWESYLETWNRIDIALDPFPFGGGITTCDALWMGTPVVTLSGRTAVGRGSSSILTNVGLPELIAKTAEEYEQIARSLAANLPRLAQIRGSLRRRMQDSPLCDHRSFARDFATVCRQMWLRWCAAMPKP